MEMSSRTMRQWALRLAILWGASALVVTTTAEDVHAQAAQESAAKKAYDDAERSFRTKDYISPIRR